MGWVIFFLPGDISYQRIPYSLIFAKSPLELIFNREAALVLLPPVIMRASLIASVSIFCMAFAVRSFRGMMVGFWSTLLFEEKLSEKPLLKGEV